MPNDELQRQITELLTPPHGPVKSYTELVSEFRAAGEPIPPGIAMLASAEQAGVL
jgi:hypothetical protein